MMTVKTLLFFCAALFTLSASSQTTASTPVLVYFELPSLSVENYPAFMDVLSKSTSFESKETCTPAKVAVVRLKNGRPEEAARASELLLSELSKAGFSNAKRLPAFNDKAFMEKCQAARYTGQ
jgi:hypothetical protein